MNDGSIIQENLIFQSFNQNKLYIREKCFKTGTGLKMSEEVRIDKEVSFHLWSFENLWFCDIKITLATILDFFFYFKKDERNDC